MVKEDLSRYVDKAQNEIKLVSSTIKDKGMHRFGRALVVALAVPLAAYQMIYGPAKRKLAHLDTELQTARTTADHADTYKTLKENLNQAYAQLPLPKDRASWLSDTVKEALRAQGVVASEFAPPTEEETNGIVVQDLNISMEVKFAEMMGFLARLEATRPLVLVTRLDVSKQTGTIGRNKVTCGLRTIIMTERF